MMGTSFNFLTKEKRLSFKILPVDEVRFVSGRLEFFRGRYQITHPDYIVSEDARETVLA